MRRNLVFKLNIMKTINWEIYYDIDETSKILDEVILEQAEILRKNLKEKRNKNDFVKWVEYV